MRILLVNVLYTPYMEGGAEVVVCNLAQGLQARGHEVRVLTTAPEGDARSERVAGIPVDYMPVRNLFRAYDGTRRTAPARALWHLLDSDNPWMAGAVGRYLRTWRPDLLHSHNVLGFSTALWRAAARAAVPVVHTLHGYYLLCPAANLCKSGEPCAAQRCARCRLYSLPRRHASRQVDQVIGVSRHVLDRHLQAGCFARAEHHVIPNACHVSGARPRSAGPHTVRRIGFLGRLVREKGIETLLKAWGSMTPRADVELHIAGTGRADYQDSLRALAGTRPDIHWRGFVGAADFLRETDLLVVPSLGEDPAPLVVQEALSHGVPVLGAARGGIPELVGDPAMLFDPRDPKALADRLAALLARPLPEPALDLGKWSPTHILERTEAVYRRALLRGEARQAEVCAPGP